MSENEISEQILDSAIAVHKEIGGPGVLESYYEAALACELNSRGISVERQKPVPIMYKGVEIGEPYRLDMLVGGKVIVECKATEKDNPVFAAQVLTYLKLTHLKLGIIINFGKAKIVDGFIRVANGMPKDSASSASQRLCVKQSNI